MKPDTRIVDNRVFLLGLDDLVRTVMKHYESTELLDAAESTATSLSIQAADVPVEGYYSEDARLTRYFLLMRALQGVPAHRAREVFHLAGFQRLKQITGSPIFGEPGGGNSLFPAGKDCLSIALEQTFPDWNIPTITARAYDIAVESNDFSLVSLAALSRDSVVLAALRETVVLYALAMGGAAMTHEPVYVWTVDNQLANRAARFVQEFNELFDVNLPAPIPDHAREFWCACELWKVLGRCVRIGFDDRVPPTRHYHWAISSSMTVEEFWDTELWTTEQYRSTIQEQM